MDDEKKKDVASQPPQTLGKSVVTVEALLGRQFDPRVTTYRDALALRASLAYAASDRKNKKSTKGRLEGNAFTRLFAGLSSSSEKDDTADKVAGERRPVYGDLAAETDRRRAEARSKETELRSVENRMMATADDEDALLLYRARYLPLVEELRVRLEELSNILAFEVAVNHAMPHAARASARAEADRLSQTRREALRASRFAEADEALDKAREGMRKARAREWPDRHVKYVEAVV